MRRRSVLGSLLALLAAAPKAIFAAEDSDVSFESDLLRKLREQQEQSEQQLGSIENLTEQARQELARAREVRAAASAELQEVEDTLYAKIDEVNTTQFQINRLQVEIHSLTQEITRQETILTDEREIASGRLRALYKLSRVSPLEIILTASNFSDALNRITVFQRILGDDVRHIRATQSRQVDLNAKYAVLAQKQAQMEDLNRRLAGERVEIEGLKAQAEAILTQRTQQTQSLQAEVWRREEEERAVKSLIQRSQALIKAEIERLRREGRNFSLPEYAPDSGWLRPAAGYVSAAYGVRTWLQPFHTGIDYAVAQFSPVVASQKGQVVHVDYAIPGNPWSSYGMMVIVAHSLHETSLYAHLDDGHSAPVVQVGDAVNRGDVIGFVGMTGFTSGPHTHFEIRVDGLTDNPARWLD